MEIKLPMYIQLFLVIFSLISANVFGGFENHVKPALNKSHIHRMRNIDFIYMINLDQRPEKRDKSLSQLRPYEIYPYRFSAVNGWELTLDTINDVGVKYEPWMQQGMMATTYVLQDGQPVQQHEIMQVPGRTYFVHCMGRGTIGIALSHLSILKDAYDSGYETIWVMEDDIDVLHDPRILPDLIEKLDKLVGKKGWDILFTDIDFRDRVGNHIPCTAYAPRPNFTPNDPNKFARREVISPDFSRIGARYGAHSMIIRRSGMRKILNFIRQYSIFLPYDMDFVLPPNIKLYCLNYDVVSQLTHAISDNGTPPPSN
jgi:GR25 family glycosyltransferase involved in LPS biosynthesis